MAIQPLIRAVYMRSGARCPMAGGALPCAGGRLLGDGAGDFVRAPLPIRGARIAASRLAAPCAGLCPYGQYVAALSSEWPAAKMPSQMLRSPALRAPSPS